MYSGWLAGWMDGRRAIPRANSAFRVTLGNAAQTESFFPCIFIGRFLGEREERESKRRCVEIARSQARFIAVFG